MHEFLLCVVGRPQLAEVVKFVTPQYTAQWKEVGSKLNVPNESLQAIELRYSTNPEWCCVKMLQKWLEVDTEATWEQLQNAVHSTNNETVPGVYLYSVVTQFVLEVL